MEIFRNLHRSCSNFFDLPRSFDFWISAYITNKKYRCNSLPFLYRDTRPLNKNSKNTGNRPRKNPFSSELNYIIYNKCVWLIIFSPLFVGFLFFLFFFFIFFFINFLIHLEKGISGAFSTRYTFLEPKRRIHLQILKSRFTCSSQNWHSHTSQKNSRWTHVTQCYMIIERWLGYTNNHGFWKKKDIISKDKWTNTKTKPDSIRTKREKSTFFS